MSHTYTISNTTVNSGTITLNTGAGVGGSSVYGSGGAGQVYVTTGTGTTSWATPNTNFNDGSNPVMTIPHGSKTVEIDKAATLDIKGNVKINGIDLEERLKTIEKVLMIPERDAIMEAKYPSLKKKFDDYINSLGKYRTFEAIKGEDE